MYKKVVLIILAIVILILGINVSAKINSGCDTVEEALLYQWTKYPEYTKKNTCQVHKTYDFKDHTIVIFEKSEQLGVSILKKNILNKYYPRAGGMDNVNLYEGRIHEFEDKPYLIIAGKNNGKISTIVSNVRKSTSYTEQPEYIKVKSSIEKNSEDYFIIIEELDSDYVYGVQDLEIEFYDSDGNDVSDTMNR